MRLNETVAMVLLGMAVALTFLVSVYFIIQITEQL